MLQGHHSCLCCTLCCTLLEHMLLVGRKKPKPKQTTSAPQLHFVELRVSRWLVPEVPTGPSGPLLSCIPATYHHLFQSTTYQARSTCRVGQPWTPPTAEIIHLHTSPFLCLYLAPPCQRQKDSGGLNDRKKHTMPLSTRVKHDASGSFRGRMEALKTGQTEKASHLWRHQLWGDLVWHVPERRIRIER